MFAHTGRPRFLRWPAFVVVRTAIRHLVMIAFEYLLIIRIGGRATRIAALTFDDGPNLEQTPKVLAVLRELDVPATFFLIGAHVAEAPGVVRALADAGMEIGNHALSHVSLRGKSFAEQAHEIVEGARLIAAASGKPVRLFRPPYGDFDDYTVAAVTAAGQAMVLWNINPNDWRGVDTIATVTRVVSAARTPAVILMHDSSPATVAAIPRIVAAYRRAGFRFVPVSEVPQGHWERHSPQFAPDSMRSLKPLGSAGSARP
jgi:peptidoglycan/xylan/chitin deacetylase (PgdA/CDA1 family)